MRLLVPAVLACACLVCGACDQGPEEGSSFATDGPSQGTGPATDEISTWSVLGGRAAHTSTSLPDGSVLVAGGCVVDGCSTATADTYRVSADAQSVLEGPLMSVARDVHTATLLSDGRVVLAGGFSGEGQPPSASVDVLDPVRGIQESGTLEVGRGGHAAVLSNGRVFVIGGWVRSRTYTSSVEVLDPATGGVTAGPELPYAADSLSAVTLLDGRVLVTGGQSTPAVGTDRAVVLDPTSAQWQEVGPMSTPRFKHDMVLLDDGRVLVIGGTPDDEELLSSTEIFDPATGDFAAGPELLEARYKMPNGALLLDDGRVAIGTGGRTVEIVDVDANTSTTLDRMDHRGSFATLNLLGPEQLLVIGGYDDQIRLRNQVRLIAITG